MGIRTADLVLGGFEETITYQDHLIQCRGFKNPNHLRNSIIQGCKQLPQEIIDLLPDILSLEEFIWDAGIDHHHINNLGKYLNEVLPLLALFEGRDDLFEDNNMDWLYCNSVYFPKSSCFKGADSFVCLNDKYYPISSKYGIGVGSSLIANVVLPASPQTEPSHFADLVDISRKVMRGRSREIIFIWGVKYHLKSDYDPLMFYNDIISNTFNGQSKEVYDLLYERCKTNPMALDGFPNTALSYFADTLARLLNDCHVSLRQINRVLDQTGVYQINMDPKQWFQGRISFKSKKANRGRIVIERGKASWRDMTGQQGMLTYRIK